MVHFRKIGVGDVKGVCNGLVALALMVLPHQAVGDGFPNTPTQRSVYVAPTLEEPEWIGTLRLFSNDWFGQPVGDRFDRWRTGGYQVSRFRGGPWTGALPDRPFDLMQYTVRGEIIAPDNLSAPASGDRRYAPAVYFGAATHFTARGFELSAGLDLAVLGVQTGLMNLHDGIHQTFGGATVELGGFSIPDRVTLEARAELARRIDLGRVELRPFAQAQAGVETLARGGVDLRLGDFDATALSARDPITGQRLTVASGDGGGLFSFSAGGDIAYVSQSLLLPDTGPAPEVFRFRLRAGLASDFGVGTSFYGITYLSPEFQGQLEGQVVGVLSLDFSF